MPARVVVYFVLALALFEHCSYRVVWEKLTARLPGTVLARPAVSSLARARRWLGARPLRALFEAVAGPVGERHRPGVYYRDLRTVAVDGTCLHVPEDEQVTWRYPKRAGEHRAACYPLLRLLVIVECGTRTLLAAAFGPESDGEIRYATRLTGALDASMLLLADAAFDARDMLEKVSATGAHFLVRSGARRGALADETPGGRGCPGVRDGPTARSIDKNGRRPGTAHAAVSNTEARVWPRPRRSRGSGRALNRTWRVTLIIRASLRT
ncbi:transposase domain-containing protein [Streptomyces sp. NBC_01264]|nr:transposase domain-containing protein [Streptomyces sp. NBC_01264]